MRLKMRTLGIDFGPAPESEFLSHGAKIYANLGDMQAAYAYEELCKLYQAGPSSDPEQQEKRERDMQIIASVFGDSADSILDVIQAECNPDYLTEPGAAPAVPVRQAPGLVSMKTTPMVPRTMSLVPSSRVTSTVPLVRGSRVDSGGLWNPMFSPFGSIWT